MVKHAEREAPDNEVFNEVAKTPLRKRRHSKRLLTKPEALLYSIRINENNGSIKDASSFYQNEQDVVDSEV